MAGSKDQLCPLAMSNELYTNATSSTEKEFFLVQNGDHNNTYIIAEASYWMRLREFMDKCLGEKTNWVRPEQLIQIKQNPMTGQIMAEPFMGAQEIHHGGQTEQDEDRNERNNTTEIVRSDDDTQQNNEQEEKAPADKKDD